MRYILIGIGVVMVILAAIGALMILWDWRKGKSEWKDQESKR